MAGLAQVSRQSVMEGVWVESNFYTVSNGTVVVGPIILGESCLCRTWSRRFCCLCWCSSQALKTISPHSRLISTATPRKV